MAGTNYYNIATVAQETVRLYEHYVTDSNNLDARQKAVVASKQEKGGLEAGALCALRVDIASVSEEQRSSLTGVAANGRIAGVAGAILETLGQTFGRDDADVHAEVSLVELVVYGNHSSRGRIRSTVPRQPIGWAEDAHGSRTLMLFLDSRDSKKQWKSPPYHRINVSLTVTRISGQTCFVGTQADRFHGSDWHSQIF